MKQFLKASSFTIACFMMAVSTQAQVTDKLYPLEQAQPVNYKKTILADSLPYKLTARHFIVPAVLFTYGLCFTSINNFKTVNHEIKEEIFLEHPHQGKHIDNYLQFAPAAAVFGLNALGVKGKNNLRDRSMICLLSNLVTNATVFSIKNVSGEIRPDGSNHLSFPSGHTAEAFSGAEFLRQEYKDVSPWYGVAGYAVAATTGYLRMYNNKHWFSDVAAGAAIGIASTRFSYWLYPKIKKLFFKDKNGQTAILPAYQNHSYGIAYVKNF
jgi:membrane-associated phospholipid phosphatase